MALTFKSKLRLLSGKMPPLLQQDTREMGALITMLAGLKQAFPRPDETYRILEIGSAAGGNALCLVEGLRATDIDVIDNGALEFESDMRQVLLDIPGVDHGEFVADSRDHDAVIWAANNGPYDLVYIDGDHTYEGVKADMENYGQLAPLVAHHDAQNCPGVVQYLNELRHGDLMRPWSPLDVKFFEHPKSCGIALFFCANPLPSRSPIRCARKAIVEASPVEIQGEHFRTFVKSIEIHDVEAA